MSGELLGSLSRINAQVMTRRETRFPLLGPHLCDRIACRLPDCLPSGRERGPFSMISYSVKRKSILTS